MKRTFAILLTLCLAITALCLLTNTASAAIAYQTEGIYTYNVADGAVTIIGCARDAAGALTLPDTLGGYPVTAIGDDAFSYCGDLTAVTIPESVTAIGNHAFAFCQGLTEFTIPAGVSSISPTAFYGCQSLTRFVVDENHPAFASTDGVIFNKEKTALLRYPPAKDGTAYTVPAGVTQIGEFAFQECNRLTDITIPAGVTEIGTDAFSDCINLSAVNLSEGLLDIGAYAFFSCGSLTDVVLPESVTGIGEYAFTNTPIYDNETNWTDGVLYVGSYLIEVDSISCESYSIRNGTTGIADCAFEFCRSLTEVILPDSVKSIGLRAFGHCDSLTRVAIGSGVSRIGAQAFTDCDSLKEIIVSESCPAYSSVGGVLFDKHQTELIRYPSKKIGVFYRIPDTVTCICGQAFFGCESLSDVTIPSSVTSIGEQAFYLCTSLTHMAIGSNVAAIGKAAFCGCESLTKLTISSGVSSIGDGAFSSCESLTELKLPGSITNIGDGAFFRCISLKELTVEESNPSYSSVDGVLFNKAKTTLLVYPQNKEAASYPIPSGVTDICDHAFSGCASLTSVTIPDSVTNIGADAFNHCTGLTSVTIPGSVTSLGWSAFSYCAGLTSVNLGNFAGEISSFAFFFCDHLTAVTIPDSVTGIGSDAFSYCDALSRVTIGSGVTYIGHGAFANCKGLTQITIPVGVTKIDDEAFSGCKRLTTVDIPDSVTYIGGDAFWGCNCLTSMTIPDGITEISLGCFGDCDALTAVSIPEGVTSIEAYAFSRCRALRSITIPESVTSIDDDAFACCDALTSVFFCGDAPVVGTSVFKKLELVGDEEYAKVVDPNLTLYYIDGKEGWTSPTWQDYPAKRWPISGLPFADLDAEKWYSDGVKFAYDNKLFNGIGAGMFSPNGTMTRAMLVTVLWRLDGETAAKAPGGFSDVPDGKWYSDAVAWAAENGIVTGTGGGKFTPNASVTREQIAVILHRYAEFKGLDTAKTADLSAFPDRGKVSAWASDALSWANAEALITGNLVGGELILAPQGNATRAQVATILMRYANNIVNGG